MKIKYIIFDCGGIETPIIFSEFNQHDEIGMARGVPVSAGFAQIHDLPGRVVCECYGESISLKLKSRPHDTKILTSFVNGGKFYMEEA